MAKEVRNWSGLQRFTPREFAEPATVEQAVAAVNKAAARSQRIRDNYMLLGAELLSALRAEADANLRMTNANRQK